MVVNGRVGTAAGRPGERDRRSHLAHQRTLLALVVEHEGRLFLQLPHAVPYLKAGKPLLHLIPQRHALLALGANDCRRLWLDLDRSARRMVRSLLFKPRIYPPHRPFPITDRRTAVRTYVVPQPCKVLFLL